MRKLILLLVLLLPFDAFAFSPALNTILSSGPMAASCAGNSCAGFSPCQNFEGTGYDNSESYSETIGTNGIVDEDDTTSTVIRGSQQLKVFAGDSGQSSYARFTVTAASTIENHFRFWVPSLPSAATIISVFFDSGLGIRQSITLNTNGTLKVAHGTGNATTTSAISTGTIYDVWSSYTAGTGGNGVFNLAVAPFVGGVTEPPTSGDFYVSGNNGSSTTDIRYLSYRAGSELTIYFDMLLGKTTPIGAVCE